MALTAPTATGAISVTPSLAFGYVEAGQSATRVLHITNNGRTDLVWTGVSSSDEAFSASPDTGTVPSGETRAIEVTFAPKDAGDFSATITVTTDATSGVNTTSVTGHSNTRAIAVSGDLAFGEVPVGESATATLSITNTGNTALTFTWVGSSDGAFTASPTSGTVAAGATRGITVMFSPTRVAPYEATITVTSDAIVVQSATVRASGAGIPPRPAPPAPPSPAAPFALTSPSFPNGAVIPERFAKCPAGAGNVSPALAWINAPGNTQSFVVIVDDPSAANWTHWVLYDIPASVTSIGEGGTAGTAGANDFIPPRSAYDGPCPPPPHGPHTYHFTVYALSVPSLNLAPGASRSVVEAALAPYVMASARIWGTYDQ